MNKNDHFKQFKKSMAKADAAETDCMKSVKLMELACWVVGLLLVSLIIAFCLGY